MSKQCYIFTDLDGPILEGKNKHYHCYKDIILRGEGTPIDIDKYWHMKRNKINRNVVLELSGYRDTYDNFLNQWLTNIESIECLRYDILKPNIINVLEKINSISDKVILVTRRQNRENLLWQLKHLNIYNYFQDIISCPFGNESTKYDSIKHYIFDKAIFIGDTEDDSVAAKSLGVKFIAITNGLREERLLDADYYFEELEDAIDQLILFYEVNNYAR